jgi:hypothetical protein
MRWFPDEFSTLITRPVLLNVKNENSRIPRDRRITCPGVTERKAARYGETPVLDGYPVSGSRKTRTVPVSGQCSGLRDNSVGKKQRVTKSYTRLRTCESDNEISGYTTKNVLSRWWPSATLGSFCIMLVTVWQTEVSTRRKIRININQKGKVKVTLVQTLRLCTGRTAHRGSRGIALPFHDHGTRREWGVNATPRPLFTPRKTRYPLYRRLGRPQGRSGQVRIISPPTGIRSKDRPARQPVAIPTELPGPLECSACVENVNGHTSI